MAGSIPTIERTIERTKQVCEESGMDHAWMTVYEVDQMYGGPEEGGWWYDMGTVVGVYRVEPTKESAKSVLDAVHVNHGWLLDERERTSAAGGQDVQVVFDTKEGEDYPAETPRYE